MHGGNLKYRKMFRVAVCSVDILATQAIIYFGAQIDFSAVPVLIHCTDTERRRGKFVGKKRLTIKEEMAYKKNGVHPNYGYL